MSGILSLIFASSESLNHEANLFFLLLLLLLLLFLKKKTEQNRTKQNKNLLQESQTVVSKLAKTIVQNENRYFNRLFQTILYDYDCLRCIDKQ